MSDKELSRFEVLQRVLGRRMTQHHAGQLLGLTRRQIYRLLRSVKKHGATGLSSQNGVADAATISLHLGSPLKPWL
jgi:hypothetical protein